MENIVKTLVYVDADGALLYEQDFESTIQAFEEANPGSTAIALNEGHSYRIFSDEDSALITAGIYYLESGSYASLKSSRIRSDQRDALLNNGLLTIHQDQTFEFSKKGTAIRQLITATMKNLFCDDTLEAVVLASEIQRIVDDEMAEGGGIAEEEVSVEGSVSDMLLDELDLGGVDIPVILNRPPNLVPIVRSGRSHQIVRLAQPCVKGE